ncbi:hypothetical protein LIER_14714 [Lithospermum erythrorhizon]|uniref:Uncharacterized protein n=1 Tax=Lithospermum erythrorhizon TaxID=34254 RepID=A0AAV3Q147_LITER
MLHVPCYLHSLRDLCPRRLVKEDPGISFKSQNLQSHALMSDLQLREPFRGIAYNLIPPPPIPLMREPFRGIGACCMKVTDQTIPSNGMKLNNAI